MNLMTAYGLGGSEERAAGHLAYRQHFFFLRILCSILGLSLFILFMGFSRQEYGSDLLFPSPLPNHCRWWLQPWNKKMLIHWKKCYDQPRQHIKKQRHYFTNKGPSSQSSVCLFPVVIYRCESSTIKKAELRRIHGFELWCWRRLLRVPWTARRSNQSILKEIILECSLEGLM